MRFIALLAAGIALSLPAIADTHELAGAATGKKAATVLPGHELGIYRFGATFSSFESYSAVACQTACRTNDACFAWSYLVGAGNTNARCELKRSGGQVERNPMATSGYSPTKERQRSAVRILYHSQKTDVKTGEGKTKAGTIVLSRPVPLGASPTVTHTLRMKAPDAVTPTSPSAKSELRYPK